jgi:uncharacterized membrane protein
LENEPQHNYFKGNCKTFVFCLNCYFADAFCLIFFFSTIFVMKLLINIVLH